jgi:hypothetical protein
MWSSRSPTDHCLGEQTEVGIFQKTPLDRQGGTIKQTFFEDVEEELNVDLDV